MEISTMYHMWGFKSFQPVSFATKSGREVILPSIISITRKMSRAVNAGISTAGYLFVKKLFR